MTTDNQYRELIRQFRRSLQERLNPIQDRIKVLRVDYYNSRGFPGGIWYDAEEEEKRRDKIDKEYWELESIEKTLNEVWTRFCTVYGKDIVQHAIEEGENRIGSIPYDH